MISLSSSRAVTTTTGTVLTARSIRSRSTPSMSGRPRSNRTTSGFSSTMFDKPPRPVAAVLTSYPISTRDRLSPARMLASSSTIRTVIITATVCAA